MKINQITKGECCSLLSKIIRNKIDLVFADPPFNINYDYTYVDEEGEKHEEYKDAMSSESYVNWCATWIHSIHRILRPGGAFWLSIGDEYQADLHMLAKRAGLELRSHVIWYYTFGVNCKNNFTRSHTHLLYFVKPGAEPTFNSDAIRVPSARQAVYNDTRANPDGRLPDNTWILRPQDAPDAFDAESNTWHIPRVAGTFKQRQRGAANQMPEQLLGRIIRACSNEGDRVLDPFVGTGTTLAVAKKLGRKYIGIEISDNYYKMAQARVRKAKQGDVLDGPIPQGG